MIVTQLVVPLAVEAMAFNLAGDQAHLHDKHDMAAIYAR